MNFHVDMKAYIFEKSRWKRQWNQ